MTAANILAFPAPGLARDDAPAPDLAVQAGPLLRRLHAALDAAAVVRAECSARRDRAERHRARWGEAPLFFFDRAAQAEWERVRPMAQAFPEPYLSEFLRGAPKLAAAYRQLPDLLDDALTLLPASLLCRRMARTVDGLKDVAITVGEHLPAARELAEVLAIPDEEVLLIVDPVHRTGSRVLLTGIADARQLVVLLADVLPGYPRTDSRIADAYRDRDPHPHATVVEAAFQLYRPAALRSDGTLPAGFAGSDFWLWGPEPTADLPRENGERVLLLGELTVPHAWDVGRKFPRLNADAEVVETLPRQAVTAWLRKRCPTLAEPALARVRAA